MNPIIGDSMIMLLPYFGDWENLLPKQPSHCLVKVHTHTHWTLCGMLASTALIGGA